MSKEIKQIAVRIPKDLYIKLRETVLHKETNMTQLLTKLIEEEVNKNGK